MMHRIESEPGKMLMRAYEYLSSINNVFIAYRNLNRKDPEKLVNKAIAFYEKIPHHNLSVRLTDAFINLMNNYVAFLLSKKRMDQAWEKSQVVYKLVDKQSFRFSNNLAEFLFINLCVLAIFRKEYRLALRYHGQLESLYKQPMAKTLLLGLVVYYELGDSELMHYKTRSLRQRLRAFPDMKEILTLFTNAFSSGITSDSSRQETAPVFADLLKNIRAMRGAEEKLRDFGGFDYIDWINSKILSHRSTR